MDSQRDARCQRGRERPMCFICTRPFSRRDRHGMPPWTAWPSTPLSIAWPVRHQAAVFNGAGRVFAPRYRQAHIRVFSVEDSLSLGSIEARLQRHPCGLPALPRPLG